MGRADEDFVMRYAIYFTPGRDDPLTEVAAGWLGRDPFTNAQPAAPTVAQLTPAEIAYHTASARRYGFHATLKAPFHLADKTTEAELDQAMAAFAAEAEPFALPKLVPTRLDGFLALAPEGPSPRLERFAGDVVRHFDRFRAPLSEADVKRRNPDALKPDEFRNLLQWGYPYVFESFRFHMTLTGRVSEQDLPRVRAAVETVFGPVIQEPVTLDGLALFVEPEPGAPFLVKSWHGLGETLQSRQERKTA
jgi:putative phosphonate metabolism protein